MQRATRDVWCLMLIASYGAVGTGVDRVRMSMKISQDENWGELNGNRPERSFLSAGYATIKGKMALNKLLKGSKPLPNVNKMYRDFQKPGNYDQALSDFYSVKPTSVRSIKMRNGDHGVVGTVGNRSIVLVTAGENTIGHPTIWISELGELKKFGTDKDLTSHLNRIIYSPEDTL